MNAVVEWRYLPLGHVRHALQRNGGDLAAVAVCGRGPLFPTDWHGTGSQREYDTVAELRACRDCARHMGGAS